MNRLVASALALMLLATALAGAYGGVESLGYAGCIWGVIMLAALAWRLPRARLPRSASRLCLLFALATGMWLLSDALAVTGAVAPDATFPSAVDILAAAGTALFCVVIAWAGRLRGLWPDLARQVDGGVFASTLFVPLWFGLIQPQGAPAELVVWSIGTLSLMGFGATYVIGGGLWNVPAVLLALGVVGNVAIDLVLHLAHAHGSLATADSLLAVHGFSFVLWTFVALHPQLPEVFAGGHRPVGVPLEARVWLLPPCVGLPVAVLAVSYVQGRPLPIAFVLGSVGVLAAIIGVRAFMESRRVESWHVSLTISFSTLVAALAAVCLAVAGQAAQRAYGHADRLAASAAGIQRLDSILLRATGESPGPSAAARTDWTFAVTALRAQLGGARRPLRQLLDDYVAQADRAIALAPTSQRVVDQLAGRPYSRLLAGIDSRARQARQAGRAEARQARLATVLALIGTLIVITLLLLRFSFAGRRLAVAYLAHHDALTGLPNRAAVEQRLRRASALAAGGAPQAQALVLLDLDDFKAVNDVHGHPVGDELLRAVALRLDGARQGDEVLARVDGDAFGVLIEGEHRDNEVGDVAHRMSTALAEPFEVAGELHQLQGSIGIAIGGAAETPDVAGEDRDLIVLRNAELAMYEAKRLPGSSIECFVPAMHDAARDRLALTADLRGAIEREELHLVYQPIVDLETGRALGYEALARWIHPTRGPLSPADFIPLAESTGLVVPLGGWVLREACRQLQTWQAGWDDRRYISVNVASQQLAAGVFPEQVREALEQSGLPADQLLLEVTESSLIENIGAAMQQMAEVKALGARFALDDFGTGYSSLSYLRQFRVDVVKVDKSFIDDVIDDDGGSLVEAIVHMAASLRMKVVAEGIEADEQAAVLRRLGCELGQGFRFSRPLNAGDVMGAPPVFGLPSSISTNLRLAGPGQPRVA